MTLSTTTVRASVIGSGAAGPFSFAFKVFAATDLLVQKIGTTGTVTQLAYPTDYTVSGVGNASGGTLTLTVALAVGESLSILRATPNTQPTSFRSLGTFFPASHEDEFDRLTMLVQQNTDAISRAARIKSSIDPATVTMELTPSTGQVLGWANPTTLTNLTLDSSAVALPGQGRTVSTLSAFLANNAVLNARDFSAKGDAVQDDTTYLQNLINQAASNGAGTQLSALTFATARCVIPRGVYHITAPLVIPTCIGFSLEGEGCHGNTALTYIQWAGTDQPSSYMLDARSVLGFVLKGITFIGQSDTNNRLSACCGNGIITRRFASGNFNSFNQWENVSVARFPGVGITIGAYAGWNGSSYPADTSQTDNSSFKNTTCWDCRFGVVLNTPNFLQCKFDGLLIGNFGGNPVDGSLNPVEVGDGSACAIKFRTQNAVRVLYGQFVAERAALYASFDDKVTPEAQYAVYCLDGSVQIIDGYDEAQFFAYFANGANALGGATWIGPNSINNLHHNPGAAGGPATVGKYPVYYSNQLVPLRLEHCDNIWVIESATSAGVQAFGCRTAKTFIATTDTGGTTNAKNPKSVAIGCSLGWNSGGLAYKTVSTIGAGFGLSSDTWDEAIISTNLVPVQDITAGVTKYLFQARTAGNTTARGWVFDATGITYFISTGLTHGTTYTRAALVGSSRWKLTANGGQYTTAAIGVAFANATAVTLFAPTIKGTYTISIANDGGGVAANGYAIVAVDGAGNVAILASHVGASGAFSLVGTTIKYTQSLGTTQNMSWTALLQSAT